MASLQITKQIEELTLLLNKLKNDLQNNIKEKTEILIFQASWVGLLNSYLNKSAASMQNFRNLSIETKRNVNQHFSVVQKQSKILQKVILAVHQIRTNKKLRSSRKTEGFKEPNSELIVAKW